MSLLHHWGGDRPTTTELWLIGIFAIGGIVMGVHFFWPQPGVAPIASSASQTSEERQFEQSRHRMVEQQLRSRGITDQRVLDAMWRVPRHLFVPKESRRAAYHDTALPIEEYQTISQPYIVGLMTQLAKLTPQSRVLEIGTGSGYQAAVLSELSKEVYSIEILRPLADSARARLTALGYTNVTVINDNGYQGCPEHAPYDAILVTAAPKDIPKPLLDQLAVGGRMIVPVGHFYQDLVLLEKQPDGSIRRESVLDVLFVPMTGSTDRKAD
jgi:protein-L-isoaspartate(D-aspartate) O-methyltransferase